MKGASTKQYRKNHPPILDAQVTLTQGEIEPSADQNLIRI